MAGTTYPIMSQNTSRSYDLLWLSLALLFLMPIAFFLSITPHDYWYYVRMGKDIVQTGTVQTVDKLSYTYAGTPIFDQQSRRPRGSKRIPIFLDLYLRNTPLAVMSPLLCLHGQWGSIIVSTFTRLNTGKNTK